MTTDVAGHSTARAAEHFDDDWLVARASPDTAARSEAVTRDAAAWLSRRTAPYCLLDLGSGTGSNTRHLAPRLPGPQRWRLVDHDPGLLATAARDLSGRTDASGTPLGVTLAALDLTTLDDRLLADSDMVTATALFDLVSAPWLDALVAGCAAHRVAVLATLTVDGRWAFMDATGAERSRGSDRAVRELFRGHQRRDKGFGPALGGRAPDHLVQGLAAAGYRVTRRPSPWRMAAGSEGLRRLAPTLLQGWRDAAREACHGDGDWIRRWCDERLDAVMAGSLGVVVGHEDIFAAPPEPGAS